MCSLSSAIIMNRPVPEFTRSVRTRGTVLGPHSGPYRFCAKPNECIQMYTFACQAAAAQGCPLFRQCTSHHDAMESVAARI